MTREQLKKHWHVIEAYKNGEQIEINGEYSGWLPVEAPLFEEASSYRAVKKIIYYYQWEKLIDRRIVTTEYVNDKHATLANYKENGYRKIEGSKRTWED